MKILQILIINCTLLLMNIMFMVKDEIMGNETDTFTLTCVCFHLFISILFTFLTPNKP